MTRPEPQPPHGPSAPLPASVRHIAETLREDGHTAYLVGGCVRDRLQGRHVSDFDIATSADPERVLALLPRAIPIGLRHGTVMVPSPDGPIDVTRFRAGPGIIADLAHRDFTINALAVDLATGETLDPFDGIADLVAGRLRAVGQAADRFAEDPLRSVRAARLAATLDLELDPEIEPAMRAAREGLRRVARERIRAELERLLVGEQAIRGIALLDRTGIARDLFGDLMPDATAVVAALPRNLDLRLAGWLRGTNAEQRLLRLRFPRRTAMRVGQLLRRHPIGADLNPKRDAAVRRLIKQAGEENLEDLFTLRSTELAVGRSDADAESTRAQFEAVRAAVARVRQHGALALRRFDLAIDGSEVMRILGCGPGRRVGRALRHLTNAVVDEPAQNDPETLRALLRAWAAANPDDRQEPASRP